MIESRGINSWVVKDEEEEKEGEENDIIIIEDRSSNMNDNA